MTISEHIKTRRKQYGLTQVELAERAGVGLRFVRELTPIYLVNWYGGEKDNAIPRECKVIFAVDESVQLEDTLQKVRSMIMRELITDDSAFELDCWCCDKAEKVISSFSSDKIIDFVSSLHSISKVDSYQLFTPSFQKYLFSTN